MKDSLQAIANSWLQLLLQTVAQPQNRFWGQFIFHVILSRFEQLFSLNKLNDYFKTEFCIYLGYLCVILKFVLKHSSVTNVQKKKKKTGMGAKTFSHHCTTHWCHTKMYSHYTWVLGERGKHWTVCFITSQDLPSGTEWGFRISSLIRGSGLADTGFEWMFCQSTTNDV